MPNNTLPQRVRNARNLAHAMAWLDSLDAGDLSCYCGACAECDTYAAAPEEEGYDNSHDDDGWLDDGWLDDAVTAEWEAA